MKPRGEIFFENHFWAHTWELKASGSNTLEKVHSRDDVRSAYLLRRYSYYHYLLKTTEPWFKKPRASKEWNFTECSLEQRTTFWIHSNDTSYTGFLSNKASGFCWENEIFCEASVTTSPLEKWLSIFRKLHWKLMRCVLISPPIHNSPCPRLISPPFQIRGPYFPQIFVIRGPYLPQYF